jgi:hypothetical protein
VVDTLGVEVEVEGPLDRLVSGEMDRVGAFPSVGGFDRRKEW